MARMKLEQKGGSISHGGEEFAVDAQGFATVPAEVVQVFVASHGAVSVADDDGLVQSAPAPVADGQEGEVPQAPVAETEG